MQQTQLDHALIQKRSGKFLRVALVASLALVSVVVSLVWLQILDSSSDDIDIKILIIKYGFACLWTACLFRLARMKLVNSDLLPRPDKRDK